MSAGLFWRSVFKTRFFHPTLISTLIAICFPLGGNAQVLKIQFGESQRLLSIHGSNTLGAALVPIWAKDYLEALGLNKVAITELDTQNEFKIEGQLGESSYHIFVAAHGSSTGFRALAIGESDIAMASRRIKPDEAEALSAFGDMQSPQGEHVVAIDGLAILVHPDNPISTLSVSELADIFGGSINNWKALGGPDLPIKRYARDENSGTWDTFKSLVLSKSQKLTEDALRLESNDELSDRVSVHPSAIGFSGLASVRESKAIAIADGNSSALAPSSLNVTTEDYPLSRRLYLYTSSKQASPRAQDFVRFVQLEQHQERVNEVGFVSLKPVTYAVEHPDTALPQYKALLTGAERLSVNFRFKPGSAELDNRAQRDITRVVDYVRDLQNTEIQLVGFGDNSPKQERALVLSKLRATAVQSALYKAGVSSRPIAGFGADNPVASDSGSQPERNQRVEVWLFNK